MQPLLQFPGNEKLNECLRNQPFFKNRYLIEKGFTDIVTNLATDRLANSQKNEIGVKYLVKLLVHDVKTGKDGYTGKPINKWVKRNFAAFDEMDWRLSVDSIERAIFNCSEQKILERSLAKE